MDSDGSKLVTRVLEDAAGGNPEAATDLLPQVYDELRNLARARLRMVPPGQTLQATALVHEAYLRVVGTEDPGWDSRGHFFASLARAMRDIMVERARRRTAEKRGRDWRRISMEDAETSLASPSQQVVAVDEALGQLEQQDPRKGQIANLRFFARMTTAETAAALDISVATVGREWRYIRTWLERQLREDEIPEQQQNRG